MNFFSDNPDLQFHFRHGLRFERFVPLWEQGFEAEDGPRSLDEACEIYRTSLGELGEFAAREIAPRAREIDEQGVRFEGGQVVQPPALLRNIDGLKALGVMAPSLPRELGGFNFPYTISSACLEIVGRACTNTMILYAFYQAPALMVARFGTPAQREQWTKALAAGDASGCVAMTEPDAGSDLGLIAATAAPEGEHWRLSGRKQFITNGCGDVCLVLARTEPGSRGLDGLTLLLVPRRENGADNYQVARPEKKFTIRGSATCELHFDGARAELLGQRGQGFRHMLTFMNEARVAVGIQALGLCQDALGRARDYAARRVQMGRPIARHPMVAELLLDLEAEVAGLRALVYACTQLQDRIAGLERAGGKGDARELERLRRDVRDRTPLLKWLGSERALWVTRSAVQIHGGYGVVQEYDVERLYRNALILPIYEGTSQIQALMSLKDQMRWALERPWRLATGAVSVQAPGDTLGDGLRELASEYNGALRTLVSRGLGLRGVLRARRGGDDAVDPRRLDGALLHAERLIEMLAVTRAAEALSAGSEEAPERRRLAERLVHRALPRVRMLAEIVRRDDREALETARGGA